MDNPTSEWKVGEPENGTWVIVLFCGRTGFPQLMYWCEYYRDKLGVPMMHAVVKLPVDACDCTL